MEKATIKNLHFGGTNIGVWLQGIQGPTYSAPWRECISYSKIKAIAGVSLRKSNSNERHSKLSFVSHLDFKQKGLDHATIFSEWCSKHFCQSVLEIYNQIVCLERLLCCLTTLQGIHQTWKMLSQSSRLRQFSPLTPPPAPTNGPKSNSRF